MLSPTGRPHKMSRRSTYVLSILLWTYVACNKLVCCFIYRLNDYISEAAKCLSNQHSVGLLVCLRCVPYRRLSQKRSYLQL